MEPYVSYVSYVFPRCSARGPTPVRRHCGAAPASFGPSRARAGAGASAGGLPLFSFRAMDDALYFSEAHLAVREMVREFARDHVAPVAAQHDADSTFPWDNVARMADLGLLGIPWSEELGGAGFDSIAYLLAIHEMAKVDASHAITISAHTTLGTSPIVHFGTDAQRARYVPLLAQGKVLGGFGFTGPDPGPLSTCTHAVGL